MPANTFGARIREERKRAGMTQQEFAALGGVALKSQNNYELSKRIPDAEYLAEIAPVADVGYIVSGKRAVPAKKVQGPRQVYGARIREERARQGWTQASLANFCEVTVQSQRNYESGRRVPTIEYLDAIDAVCDVLYILTGRRVSGARRGEG